MKFQECFKAVHIKTIMLRGFVFCLHANASLVKKVPWPDLQLFFSVFQLMLFFFRNDLMGND